MTKALFFDIDGTLVSLQTLAIPNSAIAALERAKANGTKIFISTGRPTQIMNNIGALQERRLIDGYITMNGAYCYVGDKVIYKSPVPATDVHTLANLCRQNGYCSIFVGEKDIKVCQPNDEVRHIFFEFLRVNEISESSFEEAMRGEIYQITPFFSPEAQEHIAPLMPGSEFGRWHPAFVDITRKGNTKRLGMEHIQRHFGISPSETMAFGDGGNDIAMLQYAATGIAMGNASETVKAAADYVTENAENDGIALALEHFGVI